MKQQIAIYTLLAVTGISLVGNIMLFRTNQTKNKKTPPTKVETEKSPTKTSISFGKNNVIVSQDRVVINEPNESEKTNTITIDAKTNPEIFTPYDEFARIHVKEIMEGKEKKIPLIYVARQVPNHGSIFEGYYVIIDPALGKVVKTGYQKLFETKYLNTSSRAGGVPILEFSEYDQSQGKYVITNSDHKKEFQELLAQHQLIQKKEICRINGENMTVEQALGKAKDTDKCGDQLLGDKNDKPANEFITIGEYKEILSNIQKIINGENIQIK